MSLSSTAMNLSRFELTKTSLVVREATHGPGRINAIFQNSTGETVCSRDLAYQLWHEELAVSYHPLGVISRVTCIGQSSPTSRTEQ